MNKERYNQIIDEAYENYSKEYEKGNSLGLCLLVQKPDREMFINKCKTDPEFSEKWGLKIEERELSLEEGIEMMSKKTIFISKGYYDDNGYLTDIGKVKLEKLVPTKLTILTYNSETLEIYE